MSGQEFEVHLIDDADDGEEFDVVEMQSVPRAGEILAHQGDAKDAPVEVFEVLRVWWHVTRHPGTTGVAVYARLFLRNMRLRHGAKMEVPA